MARANKGVIKIDVNDIVGKRFGKLNVLKYELGFYDHTMGGDRMRHFYLCKCDCGNLVNVHRHSLVDGNTKSCGCLKREGHKHGN